MQNVFSIMLKLKMRIKIDTFAVVSLSPNIFHFSSAATVSKRIFLAFFKGQRQTDTPNTTFCKMNKGSFFLPLAAPPRTFWAPRNPKLPPAALGLNCRLGTAPTSFEVRPNLAL